MSIEIRPIGKYFYTNNDGYLVSDLLFENVQEDWRPVINDFIKMFNGCCLDNLCSIYLRGSVATGTAVKNISDIDFLIITKYPITEEEKINIAKLSSGLNLYYDFITRFDIAFYTLEEILNIRERSLIKLLAICVYGEDVYDRIPLLKPGKDVAISLGRLEKEIINTMNEINSGHYDNNNTKAMCVWLMKRFVRSGFELVSEHTQCFTRDLYICWETFSRFYPEKKDLIYKALYLAINPTNNPLEIKQIIDNIGYWLIDEAKQKGLI